MKKKPEPDSHPPAPPALPENLKAFIKAAAPRKDHMPTDGLKDDFNAKRISARLDGLMTPNSLSGFDRLIEMRIRLWVLRTELEKDRKRNNISPPKP